MTDTRYVYGARCTWHGPIADIGTIKSYLGDYRLPCCPHCSGVIYEYPNKETWDNMVFKFNEKHPGYTEFVEWLGSYGRCWPNPVLALEAYRLDTGKDCNLGT